MRESQIEGALVARIDALGGLCRKVNWFGRVGAPDRVVMLKDHPLNSTIWVELKAPGEAPRGSQRREHARMIAMGQTVVVIDSMAQIDRLFPLPKD